MLAIQGQPRRLCNGLTRWDVLRAGGAGRLGTSLTKLLAAEQAGAVVRPRAKSVLMRRGLSDGQTSQPREHCP